MLETLPHTVAPHGLTTAEIRRLSGAAHFMEKSLGRSRKACLYWAVIGDAVLDMQSGDAYPIFGKVKSRIVREQERAGLSQYWLEVLEVTGGLHSNLVFVGTPEIASKLCVAFPRYFVGEDAIQEVWNVGKLVRFYLGKEGTSQTMHLVRREKGSHRLDGIGDRVSLSRKLKADAVAHARVQPWQRTNSQRNSVRKQYKPRALTAKAIRLSGQLELFREKQPSRLKDFVAGSITPSVAVELEFRRKSLGLTQRELGAAAGISQPQIANALHGRFGLSRMATAQLKAVLLERPAAA